MRHLARLTLLSLALWLPAYGHDASQLLSVENLLQSEERPSIEEVAALSQAAIKKHFGGNAYARDQKLEAAIAGLRLLKDHILQTYSGYHIYILGRDAEPLFDVLRLAAPNVEVRHRIHLVQLSRKVVQGTPGPQVLAYLQKHDFDLQQVSHNKMRALFVDTGHSGTIYRALLGFIFQGIHQLGLHQKGVANFASNVEFRLIATEQPSNANFLQFRSQMMSGAFTPGQALAHLQSQAFHFPMIPESGRQAAGLPSDSQGAWNWVVQNLEYTAKWMGRAQTVQANGQAVHMVEQKDKHLMNRPEYLRRQAILVKEFGVPAAEMPAKADAPGKQYTLGQDNLIGVNLLPGDIVWISKTKYAVVKEADSGSRGTVYKVRTSEDQFFALKIANDFKKETIESLANDVVKAGQYSQVGIPHAAIVAHGQGYVLKEWIEGQRADKWVKKWIEEGMPPSAALNSLRKMLKGLADKGIYVGDLNRKNMIWSGSHWYIIDSGEVRHGVDPAKAWKEFSEKINRRWLKKFEDKCEALLEAA